MSNWVLLGIAVCAVATALAGSVGATDGPVDQSAAPVAWHPCPYQPDKLNVIRCGRLAVGGPEPVTLPVVLVQVEPSTISDSAILFLQGGPGSASWLAPEQFYWPQWVRNARLPQDFIAFDQRGTGLGDPSLTCREYDPLIRPGLAEGWFADQSIARFLEATAACHVRLVAEGHDLDRFTTRRNAEDVIALMEALPYSNWTLLGTSYGSRLALEVMRLNPEGLHSVILDGVLPPDIAMGYETPALFDQVIEQIGTACLGPDRIGFDCVGSAEKFRSRLDMVLERFSADPHWVRVDLTTGDSYKLRTDPAVVLDSLFSAMTYSDGAAAAREAIEDAALGKYDTLDWYLEAWAYEQIFYDIHDPVFLSVMCDLEGDSTQEEMDRRIAEAHYFRVFPTDDGFLDVCSYWTANRISDDRRAPVTSPLPTLILSGEYDPLTPSAWGNQVAEGLVNGHHFVVPRGGHVSVFQNVCVMEMMNAFLADPSTPPDAHCLDQTIAGHFKPR